MIKLFCCINEICLIQLKDFYSRDNIVTVDILTNEVDIVIIDVSLNRSRKILDELKGLNNKNLLPIVLINLNDKINKDMYYYDLVALFEKNTDFQVVIKNIDRLIQNIINNKKQGKLIKVFCDKKELYILDKNIIFIESSRNKTIVYTKTEIINCKYIKICDCKSELSELFLKCHRSFAVNKNYITKINKTNQIIFLNNGQYKVRLGRTCKMSFLEELGLL